MEKKQINPWKWQDAFGFSQAWKVDGAETIIFVSGQASISAAGEVLHAGNIASQTRLTFENLKVVLEASGASLRHIVKLTVFITDMSNLETYSSVQKEFFSGERPAQTLVQVSALALPEMMIEVEGIAVL